MSITGIFLGVKGGLPACRADYLTAICEDYCLENVVALTSHNRMGLHGLLQGELYLFFIFYKSLRYYETKEKKLLSENALKYFEVYLCIALNVFCLYDPHHVTVVSERCNLQLFYDY
jgi:hypothetical protein